MLYLLNLKAKKRKNHVLSLKLQVARTENKLLQLI